MALAWSVSKTFHEPGILPVTLFGISLAIVAFPLLREAMETWRKGSFMNEYTLMILASAGAFGIQEYAEGIAVLLFYTVGERFQEKAVKKARRHIEALVRLRPEKVIVERNEDHVEMTPEEIEVGSIIRIPAGGRIPIDAVLLSPCCELDTSALTGESLPRTFHAGEEILAGTVNTTCPLRLQTLRPYSESALARIMKMVEEARHRKAPTELFIRRFARIYTPIVITLALAVMLCTWLTGTLTGADAFHAGLVCMVVSCPCALLIGVPLTYFCGIGKASAHGILFKGGHCMDAISGIKAVAFDKTGTLTLGKLQVVKVTALPVRTPLPILPLCTPEARILLLSAAIESSSTHPVAQAICEAAKCLQSYPIPTATEVREEPGRGMRGIADGLEVRVGRRQWLKDAGITIPDTVENQIGTASTQVHCAIGGIHIGCIHMEDRERPQAADAIAALRKKGVQQVYLLSGDGEEAVTPLAERLGMDGQHSELLPGEKAQWVRLFEAQTGHPLMFVGDGLNDAPALAAARIGIAMGANGSDASVETADVVIQDNNLCSVAHAVSIARTTRFRAIACIFLALGSKLAVMILGFLGYASLWAAVLADTGVTLLCVLVAMYGGRTGRQAA